MSTLTEILLAGLFGGAVCAITQIFIDKTKLTPAKILVFIVVFGVFIGAVGLYEPLVSLFGCGATVPLIGFGGAVARGVREAIEKDGLLGVLSGPFSAMSAGVTAALLCGFTASLFCRGKSKKM